MNAKSDAVVNRHTLVALEAGDMEPGDSIRIVCPVCNGGTSKERSLSVTVADDGAILFLCFRANCDMRGAVGGSPSKITNLVHTRQRQFKVRTDPSPRLQPLDTVDFWKVWELGDFALHLFGCKWDPETLRAALPVYGPAGRVRGWVLRAFYQGVTPKTLAVPTLAEPQLGWNKVQGTTVVVVEDIPSAIRLGEFGVRAVALNGTHMTEEATDELILEAEEVVFALDRDAFRKSVELEKKLRLHFRQTATLLLEKDFKNQTEEEVLSCLAQIPWLRTTRP